MFAYLCLFSNTYIILKQDVIIYEHLKTLEDR